MVCLFSNFAHENNRVFKRSVVQLVFISTLKSKHATGKSQWKTARPRVKSAKQYHFWLQQNHCVQMDNWPALTKTVSTAVSSVTAKGTVLMALMKTVAVSFTIISYFSIIHFQLLFYTFEKAQETRPLTFHNITFSYIDFTRFRAKFVKVKVEFEFKLKHSSHLHGIQSIHL